MLTGKFCTEQNFDGMSAQFIEPTINTCASDYLANHVEEVHKQILRMGGVDPDKAYELINDVWLSLYTAERSGEGYDISHSRDGDIITVEEFVYGRIKGYSRNVRYREGACERHTNGSNSIEIVPSSCQDTDLDNLDGFQKAYALAASYDEDIEQIELEMSLRDNLTYCMTFEEQIGFSLVSFFENMESFAGMSFNTGLFDSLKSLVKNNLNFGEAFKSIIQAHQRCKPTFDEVLSSI